MSIIKSLGFEPIEDKPRNTPADWKDLLESILKEDLGNLNRFDRKLFDKLYPASRSRDGVRNDGEYTPMRGTEKEKRLPRRDPRFKSEIIGNRYKQIGTRVGPNSKIEELGSLKPKAAANLIRTGKYAIGAVEVGGVQVMIFRPEKDDNGNGYPIMRFSDNFEREFLPTTVGKPKYLKGHKDGTDYSGVWGKTADAAFAALDLNFPPHASPRIDSIKSSWSNIEKIFGIINEYGKREEINVNYVFAAPVEGIDKMRSDRRNARFGMVPRKRARDTYKLVKPELVGPEYDDMDADELRRIERNLPRNVKQPMPFDTTAGQGYTKESVKRAIMSRLDKYKQKVATGIDSPDQLIDLLKKSGYFSKLKIGGFDYKLSSNMDGHPDKVVTIDRKQQDPTRIDYSSAAFGYTYEILDQWGDDQTAAVWSEARKIKRAITDEIENNPAYQNAEGKFDWKVAEPAGLTIQAVKKRLNDAAAHLPPKKVTVQYGFQNGSFVPVGLHIVRFTDG